MALAGGLTIFGRLQPAGLLPRLRVMRPRTMIVLALLCTVAAATLMRLVHVHELGWEWRLMPSDNPPVVKVLGRWYSGGTREGACDGQLTNRIGTTPAGSSVWGPTEPGTPVTIEVRNGTKLWCYGLMGGP
ncbi:MAG TPA: hypothetical protein PKK40_06005 [Marmoricola sp.]|nr:hypothetical protein [Marmoricola sp.]